jgi:hypothetical protein
MRVAGFHVNSRTASNREEYCPLGPRVCRNGCLDESRLAVAFSLTIFETMFHANSLMGCP